MPSKTKTVKAAMAALPSIPKELIDLFVSGPMSGEAVNAASVAFKKALIERAMGAELSHHLGYPPGSARPCRDDWHRPHQLLIAAPCQPVPGMSKLLRLS